MEPWKLGGSAMRQMLPSQKPKVEEGDKPWQGDAREKFRKAGSYATEDNLKDHISDLDNFDIEGQETKLRSSNLESLRKEISKAKDPAILKQLQAEYNRLQGADFEGKSFEEGLRDYHESQPTFTLRDAIKLGLHTKEGRQAFVKSKRDSKGTYTDQEQDMLEIMGKMGDLTERQITAAGLDTPISRGLGGSVGTRGFVYFDKEDKKPDRVFLTSMADASTLVHEKEHLTTQRTNKGVAGGNGKLPIGAVGRVLDPLPAFNTYMVLKASDEEKAAYDDVFRAANYFLSEKEMLSNIAAYEARLPEGVSIYDSPFAKNLEKYQGKEKAKAILDQAVALTLTERGRIAESDFKFDKRIDEDASYARQLYEYLRGKFEN